MIETNLSSPNHVFIDPNIAINLKNVNRKSVLSVKENN